MLILGMFKAEETWRAPVLLQIRFLAPPMRAKNCRRSSSPQLSQTLALFNCIEKPSKAERSVALPVRTMRALLSAARRQASSTYFSTGQLHELLP